jgi:hypothetical protein
MATTTQTTTSDIPSLSQIAALSARKIKYPYYDWVTSQTPAARAAAYQSITNQLKEEELAQDKEQFNQTQQLASDTASAQKKQATTSSVISGGSLALTAANMGKDYLKTTTPNTPAPTTTTTTTPTTTPPPGETPPLAELQPAAETTPPVDSGASNVGDPTGTSTFTNEGGTGAGEMYGGAETGVETGTSGASASGSFSGSSLSGLATIAAAIQGALETKDYTEKHGWTESGGVKGYLGRSSQHPVTAVTSGAISGTGIGPETLVDTGLVSESSEVGKTGTKIANLEEKSVEWLRDRTGCIIITACTAPNSYEVNVARICRDTYMTPVQLRGYYMIAERVVPKMHTYPRLKRFVKKHLVDHIVRDGECRIGLRSTAPLRSRIITGTFLRLCTLAGLSLPQYVRTNGEVY